MLCGMDFPAAQGNSLYQTLARDCDQTRWRLRSSFTIAPYDATPPLRLSAQFGFLPWHGEFRPNSTLPLTADRLRLSLQLAPQETVPRGVRIEIRSRSRIAGQIVWSGIRTLVDHAPQMVVEVRGFETSDWFDVFLATVGSPGANIWVVASASKCCLRPAIWIGDPALTATIVDGTATVLVPQPP